MELPAQILHWGVQLVYLGVDALQLDFLDIVNKISLRRHCDIESINTAPQARHMSVQALLDPLQAVWERVKTAADSLQLGESLVQAIAGLPTLPHLCHIVAPNYLDLFAQIVESNLRVIHMLRQLVLQIVQLEDKVETC